MGGFQTPGGGGITRLSELNIDADKDWQVMGISNLREIALGMTRGDMPVRGPAIIQILGPGTIGHVLTSAGPLHIPAWAPPGGALNYYFPAAIDSEHAEAIVAVDQSHNEDAPLSTAHVETSVDLPGSMVKQLTPTLASADAAAIIAAADQTINENAPMKSGMSILCDGFVEERAFDVGAHTAADSLTLMTDAGRANWVPGALIGSTIYNITDGSSGVITANAAQTATVVALAGGGDNTWQVGDTYIVRTDHTTEAREATANDLNLCPMNGTILDKIYIGSNYKFWQAWINQGTNGAGNFLNVTYYWNGAWAAVVAENDGSNSFLHGTGLKQISHTPQGDWALSNIMGMNLYWMMIRTDAWVNQATAPLGNQIWVSLGG